MDFRSAFRQKGLMGAYERALELAASGKCPNVQTVLWRLFKEGYSLPQANIGWWRRIKLSRLCRASRRERKVRTDV